MNSRIPLVAALVVALVASPAIAGCIAPAADAAPRVSPGDHPGENDDSMSADESVREDEGLSTRVPIAYYAERVHDVRGRISLDSLAVALATVNGDVTVRPGSEGAWSMVVTLRASGASAEEARRNLDTIHLAWAHEEGGRHFLSAAVTMDRLPSRDGVTAASPERVGTIVVEMPPSLLHSSLALDSTNGDIVAEGLRAGRVDADTTNGDVSLALTEPEAVRADTTNGDVSLSIRPARFTTVDADTTNGDVVVRVPEGAAFGHDVEAESTNGDVDVQLKDGSGSQEGKYGSKRATFRTTAYDERERRTVVALDSTNGNVLVGPL